MPRIGLLGSPRAGAWIDRSRYTRPNGYLGTHEPVKCRETLPRALYDRAVRRRTVGLRSRTRALGAIVLRNVTFARRYESISRQPFLTGLLRPIQELRRGVEAMRSYALI